MTAVLLLGLTELLRQLGDDDVSVREAATQALIEMGESALPEIERFESGDGEVAARLRRVARTIRLDCWGVTLAQEADGQVAVTVFNRTGKRLFVMDQIVLTEGGAQRRVAILGRALNHGETVTVKVRPSGAGESFEVAAFTLEQGEFFLCPQDSTSMGCYGCDHLSGLPSRTASLKIR